MPPYAPQQASQVPAQSTWQAPDAAKGVWQAQQQLPNGSQDAWLTQQQRPVQQQPMQPAPAPGTGPILPFGYAIAASSASVAQQVPGGPPQIIITLHGPVQAGFNDLCFCWDREVGNGVLIHMHVGSWSACLQCGQTPAVVTGVHSLARLVVNRHCHEPLTLPRGSSTFALIMCCCLQKTASRLCRTAKHC